MGKDWTPPPRPPIALRERVSYDLTFRRADEPRLFDEGGIRGPIIDNAVVGDDHEQSGAWDTADWDGLPNGSSDEQWLLEMFKAAAYEGLHEAMEWFQVDGRPFLDPHSPTGQNALEEAVLTMCEYIKGAGVPERALAARG